MAKLKLPVGSLTAELGRNAHLHLLPVQTCSSPPLRRSCLDFPRSQVQVDCLETTYKPIEKWYQMGQGASGKGDEEEEGNGKSQVERVHFDS